MQQRPDDSRFGDERTALMMMFVRVRVWMRVFFGGKQPLGTFRAREEKIPEDGHVRCQSEENSISIFIKYACTWYHSIDTIT